ncbi:MAG TPA: 4-hydroxyproline epimerase [Pyrinomonadaceae bacterium]|nr:4-hydroxyproline epimerase [Pyrinomonadaceae bacterium]
MSTKQRIKAIDSHTGGEPTRVVISGFPHLGNGNMEERMDRLRNDFDDLRSAIVREPRGHDAIVGALLCEPVNESSAAGVIFFNNVGYLGMCGHGTIGLVRTLEHIGIITPGRHIIETPVGPVEAELESTGYVSITNVPSYRFARDVTVDVDGLGNVKGDVAWGGNWFFLIGEHSMKLELENLARLTDFSSRVRSALSANNITGKDGAEIDHVELFSSTRDADSRNFVLCPGIEYDRSPCGTGTSAKLACLYADGKLAEGQVWRQESITGTIFEGRVQVEGEKIIPIIRGSAYITAELDLVLDPQDELRFGIGK